MESSGPPESKARSVACKLRQGGSKRGDFSCQQIPHHATAASDSYPVKGKTYEGVTSLAKLYRSHLGIFKHNSGFHQATNVDHTASNGDAKEGGWSWGGEEIRYDRVAHTLLKTRRRIREVEQKIQREEFRGRGIPT